jgi:hypothetical protein
MNYCGYLFLSFWRLEENFEDVIEDAVEEAAQTHSAAVMMVEAYMNLAAAEAAFNDETNRDGEKLEKLVFYRAFPAIITSTQQDGHARGHGDANGLQGSTNGGLRLRPRGQRKTRGCQKAKGRAMGCPVKRRGPRAPGRAPSLTTRARGSLRRKNIWYIINQKYTCLP